jgi:hypothetical protein
MTMATMTAEKSIWMDYAVLAPSIPKLNPKTGLPEEWKIQQDQHGKFRCSCKGFIFSRDVPKSCKHTRHIIATKGSVAGLNVVAETVPTYLATATEIVTAMMTAAKLAMSTAQHAAMAQVLCNRLSAFKPVSAPLTAAAAKVAGTNGVRRITFDD